MVGGTAKTGCGKLGDGRNPRVGTCVRVGIHARATHEAPGGRLEPRRVLAREAVRLAFEVMLGIHMAVPGLGPVPSVLFGRPAAVHEDLLQTVGLGTHGVVIHAEVQRERPRDRWRDPVPALVPMCGFASRGDPPALGLGEVTRPQPELDVVEARHVRPVVWRVPVHGQVVEHREVHHRGA